MPASLDSFGMHSSRDQMVIGEWQVLTLADLAAIGT